VDKLKLATISHAAVCVAGLAIVAGGCTMPTFRKGHDDGQPMIGSRPGPVKKLATSVSESSIGRSVSKAFDFSARKKAKALRADPTSLATKTPPPIADDYVKLGETTDRDGDTEGARQHYHKALDMEPHHLGALLGLGRLFDRQGQLDRATAHYAEAANFHPNSATAFNDLGLCLARQGKYEEAIAALHRAVEINPDKTLYRNNIATVLVAEGRISEALAHLTDAHGPAVAHYNIGYLLNKQGRRDEAVQQFQLALETDPAMAPAREWIDALSVPDVSPRGAAGLAGAGPSGPPATAMPAHGASETAPGALSHTPGAAADFAAHPPAESAFPTQAPDYEPSAGGSAYAGPGAATVPPPSAIRVAEVPGGPWGTSRRGVGRPAGAAPGNGPLDANSSATRRY
jgi:tetratricopeptide (TPR) repeat protein